ncbi:ubiquitin-like domain-containing protein [Modestobacter sp. NPDC049651]|uniref:ubiquitin-like domain-containing protein n=1 Tax=unclassified Modestobacter TaxID=2643866 RepID=UPI0033EEFD2C
MRRSLRVSLFALVLLGLVGGCAAYFVAQKTVTLTVDGQSRDVHTYAGTTGEVLADEGLTPAAHDVVLPGTSAEVADGDTIVLNRARPLSLTVDGVRRDLYTTARSVDDALDQLGYRGQDLVLSASRSERLPLQGMDLSIDTPKNVTLLVDGQTRVVSTTAATAADLLAEQQVTLAPTDTTSLALTQPLMNAMTLQVHRVQVSEVTVTEPIDYASVETKDDAATEGTRTVTTKGVKGQQTVTYRVTVTDGVETAREKLGQAVTKAPVDEQVSVGTKPKPAATVAADGLNWGALAKCESGGRPNAVSSSGTYRGMYQFSRSTWASVGGSGDPAAASAEEQTMRAQMLYARSGAGQWGCGSHLFD